MLFQTCMSFFLMLNIKEGILKNAGNQMVMVPTDFHSIFFFYNRSQWGPTTVWFFKISSFVFNIRNKLIQVWNDMRVNKWWQCFFGVNHSFFFSHVWVFYNSHFLSQNYILYLNISVHTLVWCLSWLLMSVYWWKSHCVFIVEWNWLVRVYVCTISQDKFPFRKCSELSKCTEIN